MAQLPSHLQLWIYSIINENLIKQKIHIEVAPSPLPEHFLFRSVGGGWVSGARPPCPRNFSEVLVKGKNQRKNWKKVKN